MKSQLAEAKLNTIDIVLRNIVELNPCDELQSYLAQYLTVFISGIYEETIEVIINEKIKKSKRKYLNNFFDNYLRNHFQNPNFSRVCDLLVLFNEDWREEIKKFDLVNKDALNSIVTNKNKVAHGLSCDLTINEVVQYYNNSKPIIEKIDEIVL